MPTLKLTKKNIEASMPDSGRRYEIWDTQIKGLLVEVNPSGRKTFYFRFSDFRNRKQKLKIGVFGSVTCEIARDVAQGWAGDLARGIDPRAEKIKQREEEKTQTFFSDFFEIFTENYRKPQHKKKTFKNHTSLAKLYILPFFGKKFLSHITTTDILAFKESLKHKRPTYNQCFLLLSRVFKIAEMWGYKEKNSSPCTGTSKYPESKKEQFLTASQLTLLEKALTEREAKGSVSPYVIAAIRLLMYTGCRLREILDLKWEDVHLSEKYLLLKDSKTGERIVPLNDFALSLLSSIKKRRDNPHVCCGRKRGQSLGNPHWLWWSLRHEIGLPPDFRIHDLRHSFASFAIKQGLDLFLIAKLLGHRQVQTTMRYAHIGKDDLIHASNIVGKSFQ